MDPGRLPAPGALPGERNVSRAAQRGLARRNTASGDIARRLPIPR
jgi:hypothetical protein